jgi:hypothetical protein
LGISPTVGPRSWSCRPSPSMNATRSRSKS